VAVLRLNRPEKLNAISTEVERALQKALVSNDVRASGAVIVTGQGRAFSAGADISEFEGRSPEDVLRYYEETGGVYEELATLPQPTVGAIHGYSLGGGGRGPRLLPRRSARARTGARLPDRRRERRLRLPRGVARDPRQLRRIA